MSRPLRIEWAGGLYHVTSRGDRREAIVEDDADRRAWVRVLGECCERFGWRVHAWCLMSNHYHLLLETLEPNLSLGMRQLNGVWSQEFNRRHRRVGHVFQGRYKAIMVEREAYLRELARYVVLNPVRAGMVNDPGEYAWSSYRATAGVAAADEPAPAWLETDALLTLFARRRAAAQMAYVDFVRAGVGLPSLWERLQAQVFLGSPEFVLEMQARLAADAPLRDVPILQRRAPRRPLAEFLANGLPRDEAMARAFRHGHYRQREIAEFFGVHEATVSWAVRALRCSRIRVSTFSLMAGPIAPAPVVAPADHQRALVRASRQDEMSQGALRGVASQVPDQHVGVDEHRRQGVSHVPQRAYRGARSFSTYACTSPMSSRSRQMPKAGWFVMKSSAVAAAPGSASMRTVTCVPACAASLARQAAGRSSTFTCSMTTSFMTRASCVGARPQAFARRRRRSCAAGKWPSVAGAIRSSPGHGQYRDQHIQCPQASTKGR